MAAPQSMKTAPRHGIGLVSRRTGLSQLLLRAWERRYGIVSPGRTETGRRLYSDQDIERLTLLRILTDSGYRIGDIADQALPELKDLAAEVVAPGRTAPAGPARQDGAGPDQFLAGALEAVEAMDARALEGVLERASVGLAIPVLRRGLIQPLMVQIGERWRRGDLRVAQEHMATAIVRTFLAGLNSRQMVAPGSPVLAVAAPSGDLHEMGALLAASHALEVGWEVLYLGPNLPAEEMAAGVQARSARGLFLSLVYPVGDPGIVEQLERVRRLLGGGFPILVGGGAAQSYLQTLDGIGAVWTPDPGSFDLALAGILDGE